MLIQFHIISEIWISMFLASLLPLTLLKTITHASLKLDINFAILFNNLMLKEKLIKSYHHSILKLSAPWKEARHTDIYHPIIRPWSTSLTWETVPIKKHMHICTKQRLCHNIKRKNSLSSLWELKDWLFIKTWIPFAQRYNTPSLVKIYLVVL